MRKHKSRLSELATGELLARRGELAAGLGDVDRILSGSLVWQTRRCGRAGCRCADGAQHGPYPYFTPRAGGGRLRYVPARLAGTVASWLARGSRVQSVIDEIAEINAELVARREAE